MVQSDNKVVKMLNWLKMSYFLLVVSQIIARGVYLKTVESPEETVNFCVVGLWFWMFVFFHLFAQSMGLSKKRVNCDFGKFGYIFNFHVFLHHLYCICCQISQKSWVDNVFNTFHKNLVTSTSCPQIKSCLKVKVYKH